MINAEGENVDLYIPRKCSWTNRLITATDKASVQLNVGHLDANGVYTGQYTTVALAGYVRSKVRRDDDDEEIRRNYLFLYRSFRGVQDGIDRSRVVGRGGGSVWG